MTWSGPTDARSKIAEERVSRKMGRPRLCAIAEVRDQHTLCGLFQTLFDHVYDQSACAFGFQSNEFFVVNQMQ